MLGTFKSVAGAIKLRLNKVRIDTPVFRLHYRVTFIILVVCSILVSSRQYLGEHIHCIHDSKVRQDVINSYCFISATFTVPAITHDPKNFGHEAQASYAGLGPYDPEQDDVTYHAYYQWVPFVLFIQALMFYAPYSLWKAWESSKVKTIIQGLHLFAVREDDPGRTKQESILANYINDTIHDHNSYAYRLFFCEALNFANVIGQIFLVNRFLGGEFMRYGLEVIKFLDQDPETRYDPMARVFPKITKCVFHKFGFSGTVEKHDAMCVLSLNIMNEKIYTFLWFWLIILAVITLIDFLARILVLVLSPVRTMILRSRLGADKKNYADDINRRCHIGDYILLDLLSRNMDTITFGRLISQLSRLFSHSSTSSKHSEDTPILS